MNNIFLDAFNAISGDEFEEIPVAIETFVTSDDYLNLPPLSAYQYQIIRAGSQIYRQDTLMSIYGEEDGYKRWQETYNELVLQLGKASGKDYMSTIICTYIVYLLLCLKNPAKYYGKPKDDTIDIVNIAVNSDQAKNVFFANLQKRVKNCPWFRGKIVTDTAGLMEFDKSIRVISGHSQREAFEGLNVILAVLDEISAFELESKSGNEQANTADATYNMYRASVDSRFADFGKVLLLSFPRYENDPIQQRYNAVVADKEVIIRKRTLRLDPDLPDGVPGNEFEIEWEEDHILSYKYPRVWALKRPSWEVNPTVNIDSPSMIRQFHANMADALGRFACMPSNNIDASFFKNKNAIDEAFVLQNPVDERGVFLQSFQPRPDTEYYIHVDLSKVHDRCAIGLAHVDSWKNVTVGEHYSETYPIVVVDALRWWQPSHDKPMDYKEVTDYILSLKRRGFNIKLVTFDRWNSNDTMNFLESHHIKTELLSVANNHYHDFLSVMYDNRMLGPRVEELITELKQLRYVKDKVDHIRSGYKDLSDAICGAIYNAVTHTLKPTSQEIDIVSIQDLRKRDREQEALAKQSSGLLPLHKKPMPDELANFMQGLRLL